MSGALSRGLQRTPFLWGKARCFPAKRRSPNNYSEAFKAGFTDNVSPSIKGHVAGNMAWAVGSYSVAGPGPNNSTEKYHGNWGAVYVNDGGAWKVRMRTFNSHRDSRLSKPKRTATQAGACRMAAAPPRLGDAESRRQCFCAGDEAPKRLQCIG